MKVHVASPIGFRAERPAGTSRTRSDSRPLRYWLPRRHPKVIMTIETDWSKSARVLPRDMEGSSITYSIVASASELDAKFRRLADWWRRDTFDLSSTTKMFAHKAYQRIIGMGEPVVPLILRDLQKTEDHWFNALNAITEEDPVAPEDAGDLERMTQAWLRWGQSRGYLRADADGL